MTGEIFPGRLGIQQRVLPAYRAAFFEVLARQCEGGLSVFAGKPLAVEGIEPVEHLNVTKWVHANNWSFLDPSSPWFMCWQGGFIRWLDVWQPEVLIVEANPRYPVTRKAIAWMHAKGREVIGWGLGAPPIRGPLKGLRQKQRQELLNSLASMIAYSRIGGEQYRKLGMPAKKVYVAPNAVALAPSHPPRLRPPQFDGQPTILFVGRLQRRKRVDLLLEACAALPAELRPKLEIVGDGPALGELQQIAARLYPGAEFVGAKHGAELEPYFDKADLFVLPGTGGLAIQQAMAHGLPVVVAGGDGSQDDLVRSENGWQVPGDDPQSLIAALREALSQATRLRQLGEASYRIVAQEINIEKMVEVFIRAANDALMHKKCS
jgi:glycosyltransferase involved in cell wall biosynthesis